MDGSNKYTHYGISCFNYLILSSTAATSPDTIQLTGGNEAGGDEAGGDEAGGNEAGGNEADGNKAGGNKAGKC